MRELEPTYLRYVFDELNNGSISSDNSSSLPYGFVGIFEKEFSSDISSVERSKLLKRLALWSLLKRAVSTNFYSKLLNEDEDLSKQLIDRYSNWFNSPEPGKYVLFHDRLRVFLLQKLSNHEINELNEQIISYLEASLKSSLGDESESYALEYLSHHMLVESQMDTNYDRLINYTNDNDIWSKQISLSNEYKWSQRGLNGSIKESARRHLELNTLKSTVNSLKLNLDEKNSSKEILNFLHNEDYYTALSRALTFEGENLILIHIIMIHELTIGSLSHLKSRDDALKEIIKSISDNTDGIVPDWYPGILILQYQIEFQRLGLIIFDSNENKYDDKAIVLLKNMIYKHFWPLVVDENLCYLDKRISLIPSSLGYDDLEFNDLKKETIIKIIRDNTGVENSIIEMLYESDLLGYNGVYTDDGSGRDNKIVHINDFNDFNFQNFNISELIAIYVIDNNEHKVLCLLYCAYRYFKLESDFIGFIDKKTSKMIKSKEDAALMCFEEALRLVEDLEEKDFYQDNEPYEPIYQGNLKGKSMERILKVSKLFSSKKGEEFKNKLLNVIERDNFYKDYGGLNLEIFNKFLSEDQFEGCIDVCNRMVFPDYQDYSDDKIYCKKSDCVYRLLKTLILIGNKEMYERVYEMLPNDYWRCKIEIYETELLYQSGKVSEATKIVYEIYNRKSPLPTWKKNWRGLGNIVQKLLKILFKYDVKNAFNLLDHYKERLNSLKHNEIRAEQYSKIFVTMKENKIEKECKEYFEKSINTIKLIKQIRIKEGKYGTLLKELLKIDDHQLINDLIKHNDESEIYEDEKIFWKTFLYNKELALKYAKENKLILGKNKYSYKYYSNLNLDELLSFSSVSSSLNLHIINEIANKKDDLLINHLQKILTFNRPKINTNPSSPQMMSVFINGNILKLLLFKNSKNKSKSLDYINLFSKNINEIVYNDFSDTRDLRTIEISRNIRMDILIGEFYSIKYLYNSLSFKNKTESINDFNKSLIEEMIKNLKSINPLFDSRVLGNQKTRIAIWLSNKLYNHGYIEDSQKLISYAEELDIEMKKNTRIVNSLDFEIYSQLLLRKFKENQNKNFIKIADEFELDSNKFHKGYNNEQKYYFMLNIVSCLIASNNINEAIKSMKKQLEEIFSYADWRDDWKPGEPEFLCAPDYREHLLHEYINILKKISGGINENSKNSALKIDSNHNKDLYATRSRFDEKYNEQSMIKECERLLNKDFLNFDFNKYLKSHHESDCTSSIEGFDSEILLYKNLRFNYNKNNIHSVILKDIEYENHLNKEIESESSEFDQMDSLNYLYKIDKKYLISKDLTHYLSASGHYLFKSISKKNEYDFLELSEWDDNSIFHLHINSINSYNKKMIILFYYAKMECFFKKNKSENKINLLKQAIDFDQWIQLSSKL